MSQLQAMGLQLIESLFQFDRKIQETITHRILLGNWRLTSNLPPVPLSSACQLVFGIAVLLEENLKGNLGLPGLKNN